MGDAQKGKKHHHVRAQLRSFLIPRTCKAPKPETCTALPSPSRLLHRSHCMDWAQEAEGNVLPVLPQVPHPYHTPSYDSALPFPLSKVGTWSSAVFVNEQSWFSHKTVNGAMSSLDIDNTLKFKHVICTTILQGVLIIWEKLSCGLLGGFKCHLWKRRGERQSDWRWSVSKRP